MLKLDIQKRTSFYRSSARCTFQWRQSRSIESFLYLAPPAASAAAARNSPPLNLQSFEDALFLYTDPVPSWINHYRLILIQCHQVPTSRATYWPSTIMYQPVSPSSDPVPPSTEQYRLLLNQYHHISTSAALYWPNTTKYQSIPTYIDPVPPSTNRYRHILTQHTLCITQLHLFEPIGSFRQKIKPYSMLSFFTPSLYSRVFMIVLYALIIAVAGQITSTLIIGSCNYLLQTSPLIIFVQLNWWAFQLWAIPLWCLQ